MADQSPSAFGWDQAWLDHRDNLPHVRQENVVYFVTFRLADSLPAERVAELRNQREQWLRLNPLPHTRVQEREYRRIWTVRIENLLDAGYGACVLRDPACREILEASIRHDDGVAYRLGEFVIMPNHVHALLQMLPGRELGESVKAWKSVSARRIGKRLGRLGSYWMDEYFDHSVRHDASLARFVSYIRENPMRLSSGSFTLGSGTLGS
ncbi:MAG TPA: transposase [Humisphaera sp.]|nr:transposase [Humisphaera sp.]